MHKREIIRAAFASFTASAASRAARQVRIPLGPGAAPPVTTLAEAAGAGKHCAGSMGPRLMSEAPPLRR
jgi:hypothetical protein